MTDGPAFYEVCAHCGSQLGLDHWPPVVEAVDVDGETVIRSYCDEECMAAGSDG